MECFQVYLNDLNAASLGNTIFSAIRNSSAFYFAGADPLDWTLPQNASLWNDDLKTLFDPCPSGWRVPKSGTGDSTVWRDFGNSEKDYTNGAWTDGAIGMKGGLWHTPAVHSGQAWYPANGCRLPSTGEFVVVDEIGHAWSSSLTGTQASFLRLWDPSISPIFPIPRGYSFSVRCVRE